MGKGLKAGKKKKNPNKLIVTQKELNDAEQEAEARWQEDRAELTVKCSQRVSIWYQAITYLALCNKFNFSNDDLFTLQAEMDRISHKIMATEGKHRNYSIDTVRKELLKYNVEFDMDEIERIESD